MEAGVGAGACVAGTGSSAASFHSSSSSASSSSPGAGAGAGAGVDVRTHTVVMEALRQHLLLHGARVSEHLHHAVTHIIMRPQQLSRACKIRVST